MRKGPVRKAIQIAVAASLAFLLSGSAAGQAPATPATAAQPTTAERQKLALQEADRLFELAQQLKVTLDKTRRDELSMQVIREADEIEKLARSVKTRLR